MAADPALAARPDTFELVRGGPTARLFRMVAVVDLVIGVGLGAGMLLTSEDRQVTGVVFIVFGVLGFAAMLWLASRQSTWRMRDGRPLAARTFGIPPAAAEETYARVASGDPAAYTPLETAPLKGSTAWLRTFSPEGEDVTYAVVVRTGAGDRDASPIVELRGAQHAAFQAAMLRGFAAA